MNNIQQILRSFPLAAMRLLLIIGGLATTGLWSGTTLARDSYCRITINSQPSGATVKLNHVPTGTTPSTRLLPAGKFFVSLKHPQAYTSFQTFDIPPMIRETNITFQLSPRPAKLIIHSTPPGAHVLINETDYGKTPTIISDLTAGLQSGMLTHPDFQNRKFEIQLQAGEIQPLNITMENASAAIHINSRPTGASVFINDSLQGQTPLELKLDQRPLTLAIRKEGFAPIQEQIKHADYDHDRTFYLQPLSARLAIDTIPTGAKVTVEDHFTGRSPVNLDNLPSGDYKLHISHTGYADTQRTITIHPGTQTKLQVPLTPNGGRLQLTTTPSGAKVMLNNRIIGTTATTGTNTLTISHPFRHGPIEPGVYELLVSMPGYEPVSETLQIDSGQSIMKHISLKRPFRPNFVIETDHDTFRGYWHNPQQPGDIHLEVASGLYQTIKRDEVIKTSPIP